MEKKYVVVPFEQGGYAKLCFTPTQDGNNWVCVVPDETMDDLQALLNGEEPRETARPWNGFPWDGFNDK